MARRKRSSGQEPGQQLSRGQRLTPELSRGWPSQQDMEHASGYWPGCVQMTDPGAADVSPPSGSARGRRGGWRSISGVILRLSLASTIVGFGLLLGGLRIGYLVGWAG